MQTSEYNSRKRRGKVTAFLIVITGGAGLVGLFGGALLWLFLVVTSKLTKSTKLPYYLMGGGAILGMVFLGLADKIS